MHLSYQNRLPDLFFLGLQWLSACLLLTVFDILLCAFQHKCVWEAVQLVADGEGWRTLLLLNAVCPFSSCERSILSQYQAPELRGAGRSPFFII